ncbi:hypothetical protein HYPBUDRAFT_151237 [Hyphopichia burtonii NRRL Y-1933]|uniref:Uncharacterized protein n=1 Tax=Hyphopichia burtonii NRRL Y-1933 TaxID=984485 RepID=A0A1E4RQD6_9ASCO|nr:hypothetical protein HYPBUDRAFT_151237 [Hyphopichia burtonii NRRL Y-1933]ODV69492.1 hypothetical protein HYPBUDRAFT_151237 [Hyphopichia burtonii NRRL Y-1933]
MTLYFTTVSICLILRRAIYVKWTPYVEECCVRLQESGIPKMKSLALFLRLSHELERIHHIVHSPDSNDKAGQSSRYIISELQKNLNTIKAQIDPQKHSFLAYYYSVEAYLHEPTLSESVTKALNSETDQDSFKLNTNTIMSIAQCTTSCLKALDSFTLMSPSEISALPIIYAARIIYTAGMLLRLRYLIISLPSHIEKDLVPRHAVFVIQKLTRSLDQAGIIHPANHFLKKLHLVLQLFVQTYATQVQDLLQKNGETPENLVPTNVYRVPKRDLEKLSDLYNRSHVGGLLTTESGKQYASQISLDLLSYAASVRRDGKSEPPSHLPKQVGSPLRIANDIQPQDSNERSTNKQYHVTNNSSSGDQRTLDDTTYFPNPKLKNRNTKIQGLYTSGSNLDPSLSTLRYSTPPSGLTTNQNVDLINTNSPTAFNNSNQLNANPPSFQHRGDVNGASSFNPVNSFNMPNPNPNLQFNGDIPIQDSSNPLAKHIANPDQLENSYLALNDEFWSDLLNADSNKLNFNNKSAGDNMNSEEFFFMQ